MAARRLTALCALALTLAAVAPILGLAVPAAASGVCGEGESPCVVERNQVLNPNIILLGETTQATLTVKTLCPNEEPPIHIVIVLDGSSATTEAARRYEHETALAVLNALRLEENPEVRVGVVVFGDPDPLACALTNDRTRVKRCLGQVLDTPPALGDVDDLGLDEAMAVLAAGRGSWIGNPAAIREVVFLLSDARCVTSCREAQQAAREAKRQDALLMTACASHRCDRPCVRSLASRQRYFFDWPIDPDRIRMAFTRIRDEVVDYWVKGITITGTLPDGTRYVPDSAVPSPTTVSADGRTFTWVTNYVPKDGITVTLRLVPESPGQQSGGLVATGQLLDYWDRTKDFAFPQPWAMALAPGPSGQESAH